MAKKRCRGSKRKWEQEKLEEIEDLAKRQEIRQLYKKTGQLKDFNQERQSVKTKKENCWEERKKSEKNGWSTLRSY